ncbi:hypothetical protein PYCCODRAFT_1480930 [Trametes coccinea BRFM310]|uniref:Autophagy-related protein 29 n=1 Tax=Trametes coccinea (strain BRFM310) TaxID=1353009 RepID=A0A1Y2I9U7_TRAC3|nr:hypothetical protein PYCCODRAFT_1480930 [Trametes coccinea BRFM310]
MPSPPPTVRVVIRLPYNRPEDAPPDPLRVDWNAEKEQILWEVIAKSRAIEGAGTDWKGLAGHLQVPLPYLLYRAQARYEEDLRGLKGLGIQTPAVPFPSAPSPLRVNAPGEYFPRVNDPGRPPLMHRDSHVRMGSSSSANGGLASTSGTVPGTSTLRPIRARLSSLGQARGHTQLRSPSTTDPGHSPLAGKKISSSSTLTLQGPKRLRSPRRPLSPASSRAGTSPENEPDDLSEESDGDEEARKEEAERQESLAQKLQKLQKLMTTDALGLVADPASISARNGKHRGRPRPLSGASASGASLSSSGARRSPSRSRSHGNQSLSSASVDSPQGSIPSIPSPPANLSASRHRFHAHTPRHAHSRHLSQGANGASHHRHPTRSQSQSLSTSQSLSQSRSTTSQSNTQSPPRVSSPMPVPRHLTTPEKSSSPPALSPGRAVGQTHVRTLRQAAAGLAAVSTGTASEASSFSDLSDADLSSLESALMSNTRGTGSRLSSFARSHLTGGRRATRG